MAHAGSLLRQHFSGSSPFLAAITPRSASPSTVPRLIDAGRTTSSFQPAQDRIRADRIDPEFIARSSHCDWYKPIPGTPESNSRMTAFAWFASSMGQAKNQ